MSPNDLSSVLREVMGQQAKETKYEKEVLEYQTELLKQQRKPMLETLNQIERRAERKARLTVFGWVNFIFWQFMLV